MRRCSLLVAAIMMAATANASPVGRSEAKALAAAFLRQPSVEQVSAPFVNFYIFNGDQSFVILSADDAVIPVLGYSFEQPFNMDMAEGTKEWLQAYDDEIQSVKQEDIKASDEVKAAWESLRNEDRLPSKIVGPLVDSYWSQYAPYNMHCPEECVTGCVATAMAQIMRYWEWPIQGVGSHSYTHEVYGTLSANFGATTYDWEHMANIVGTSSSNVAKEAVATLCYHCGISVDMTYRPEASSAPSANVLVAMPTYFQYDASMSLEHKYDYTDVQWKQLLKDELDAYRPMFYVGQDRVSAHAFICDGYDERDYFHFNWGWGGVNSGFFAIGSLNPGSQGPFNANNYAIVGIKPVSGGTPAIHAPTSIDGYPEGLDYVLSWYLPTANQSLTYNVSRDGVLLASGLTLDVYTDENAPSGSHTYEVWANLGEYESNHKATYDVELAFIDAVSSDPLRGTVTGRGLEELDFLYCVKAIPNPSYIFLYWMEDDVIVSTEEEYRFNVTGDRHLTAYFSGLGVDEDDETFEVRRIEVFSINGVRIESLENCAKGVYLLRITTDKGVMIKKVAL